MTRITSHLLKVSCVMAVVFCMSAPSAACWFPFCWQSRQAYRPVYYAPVYRPAFRSGCSPCGSGGCGVQSYYGAACSPCSPGCAPCQVGCTSCGGIGCSACGNGCDVGYAADAGPVPDNGDRQTYAPEDPEETTEEATSEEAGGEATDEVDMSAPGDDDFGPVEREESDAGDDPFPDFERPVLPLGTDDDEESGPQPLDLDEENVTLRVLPTRHRVRAEARYRVPRLVRLEVAPESPWRSMGEVETHVVVK